MIVIGLIPLQDSPVKTTSCQPIKQRSPNAKSPASKTGGAFFVAAGSGGQAVLRALLAGEAQHPFGHCHALMLQAHAADGLLVTGLAEELAAQVEQAQFVVVDEFRVGLEAQHLVANAVGGVGAERAAGQQRGTSRQFCDLVLMEHQHVEVFQARAHPLGLFEHGVAIDADAPALRRAFGLATQQQGQQLVAEADADQAVAVVIALKQELAQGLDPRISTERVGLAAGNQVGVVALGSIRVATFHHVEHIELRRYRLLLKQLPEHSAIAVVLLDQLRSEDVGFQDADAHGHSWGWLPLVGCWNGKNARFLTRHFAHENHPFSPLGKSSGPLAPRGFQHIPAEAEIRPLRAKSGRHGRRK